MISTEFKLGFRTIPDNFSVSIFINMWEFPSTNNIGQIFLFQTILIPGPLLKITVGVIFLETPTKN